jgi:NAD(P)-dependent dehydrogenase (short-subunit alcohol dehydrogenase family)
MASPSGGILDGKVALITGAGQGVGQGIAFAFAKEGARIAAIGRTESKLLDTVKQIEGFGGHAVSILADVNDPDAIQASIDATLKAFGRIDILVNNAYGIALGPLLSLTDADFESCMTGSPLATFRYMKACYPHLKAAGHGVILNLSTSATRRWDAANYGFYAASKRAVEALSRAASAEWGPDGIRVNTIAPHALSPGLKGWIEANPEEAKAFFKTIPLGRVGDCEHDIGAAALFLASPAARYVTGVVLPLDGGQAFFG